MLFKKKFNQVLEREVRIFVIEARDLVIPYCKEPSNPIVVVSCGKIDTLVNPKDEEHRAPRSSHIRYDYEGVVYPGFDLNVYFSVRDNQLLIGSCKINLFNLNRGVKKSKWCQLKPIGQGEILIEVVAVNFGSIAKPVRTLQMQPLQLNDDNLLQTVITGNPEGVNAPAAASYSARNGGGGGGGRASSPISSPTSSAIFPTGGSPSINRNMNSPTLSSKPLVAPPLVTVGKTILKEYKKQQIKRILPHVASGHFGIVYKGHVRDRKEEVAIKDIKVTDYTMFEEWKKEVEFMSQHKSAFVVEVYGFCCNSKILTIVMEYMENGSLYELLHGGSPKPFLLNGFDRLRMARQVSLGIGFLHINKILHRDVKSLNILISKEGVCKLSDFGSAKLVNVDQSEQYTADVGTPLWMAPEVRFGQTYCLSADVFSLGVVLYEIFENKLPDYDHRQHLVIIQDYNFSAASIISPMLNLNPKQRPSAETVARQLDAILHDVTNKIYSHTEIVDLNSLLFNHQNIHPREIQVINNIVTSCLIDANNILLRLQQPEPPNEGRRRPNFNTLTASHKMTEDIPLKRSSPLGIDGKAQRLTDKNVASRTSSANPAPRRHQKSLSGSSIIARSYKRTNSTTGLSTNTINFNPNPTNPTQTGPFNNNTVLLNSHVLYDSNSSNHFTKFHNYNHLTNLMALQSRSPAPPPTLSPSLRDLTQSPTNGSYNQLSPIIRPRSAKDLQRISHQRSYSSSFSSSASSPTISLSFSQMSSLSPSSSTTSCQSPTLPLTPPLTFGISPSPHPSPNFPYSPPKKLAQSSSSPPLSVTSHPSFAPPSLSLNFSSPPSTPPHCYITPEGVTAQLGTVLFTFDPLNEGELYVKENDPIQILAVNGEWAECLTQDSRHGWVPFSYVQILDNRSCK